MANPEHVDMVDQGWMVLREWRDPANLSLCLSASIKSLIDATAPRINS